MSRGKGSELMRSLSLVGHKRGVGVGGLRAKEVISRVLGPVRACPATSVPLRLAASITARWQTQELKTQTGSWPLC